MYALGWLNEPKSFLASVIKPAFHSLAISRRSPHCRTFGTSLQRYIEMMDYICTHKKMVGRYSSEKFLANKNKCVWVSLTGESNLDSLQISIQQSSVEHKPYLIEF